MRTNNPTRGLLVYAFYSVRGNISIAALLALALGVAFLITQNFNVYNIFVLVTIGAPPYLVMMKFGAKNQLHWEKFQISMPLKRKNLVASFYLSILIATVAGLLLCGIILGIGFVFREGLLQLVTETGLVSLSMYLGIPLLMAALLLPIGSTKFGENKGEIFFMVCIAGALGITLLISWLGNRAGLPDVIIYSLIIAVAAVAYAISYHITSKIYAKTDFR